MKHNLIVLLCCLLSSAVGYSQGYLIDISGRVTNATTGMGMNQQVVTIVVNDTLNATLVYAGTQLTDTAGYYALNFTGVGLPPTGMVGVSVTDCNGAILTQTFVAFGANITLPNVDFAICPTVGNCQANFTASTSPGSTVVQFTDASIVSLDTVITRAWYMNGDTLFTQNPSYTFPAVGTYNVCLDITTSLGCTDYQCNNIAVGTTAPACQATLTYGQLLSGAMGLTASASGTASIVYYAFDFGDSNSIHAIDSTAPYSYPTGLYNACVDVVFADSCIAHACTLVNIGVPNCQAFFTTVLDTTQQYSLLLVNSCLGNNLHYTWDFGDGSTSTLAYPQHTYAGPGTYNICVSVVDSPATCTATSCDSAGVGADSKICHFGSKKTFFEEHKKLLFPISSQAGHFRLPCKLQQKQYIASTDSYKSSANDFGNYTLLCLGPQLEKGAEIQVAGDQLMRNAVIYSTQFVENNELDEFISLSLEGRTCPTPQRNKVPNHSRGIGSL